MQLNKMLGRIALSGFAATLAACGGGQKLAKTAPAAPKPAAAASAPSDPVTTTIAEAEKHLSAGMEFSNEGQLDEARQEFDKATDTYLAYPGGALSEPRLAEAFRRTVEAIHEQEVATVTDNDNLKEEGTEPAAIDEVGGMPLPEGVPSEDTPPGCPGGGRRRPDGLPRRDQQPGPRQRRAVPGSAPGVVPGGPRPWCPVHPPHPKGFRGRGNPAGPRVRRARRKRLSPDRPVALQGEGGLAVRRGDRAHVRPQAGLLGR